MQSCFVVSTENAFPKQDISIMLAGRFSSILVISNYYKQTAQTAKFPDFFNTIFHIHTNVVYQKLNRNQTRKHFKF